MNPFLKKPGNYFAMIPVIAVTSLLHAQDSVTDIDGNRYPVVRIGTQVWMAENLRVHHDPSGNPIEFFSCPEMHPGSLPYGCYYSWGAAMNGSGSDSCQGICPAGWHLPSDEEWTMLTSELGGQAEAGHHLKKGQVSGFKAVMSGNHNPVCKICSFEGENAYFWTSTEFSETASWMRHIGMENQNINRSTVKKHYGFSVRCIKDP